MLEYLESRFDIEIPMWMHRIWWAVTPQPKCPCCGERSETCEWWSVPGGGVFRCEPCQNGTHKRCGCSCMGCTPITFEGIQATSKKHTCGA